MRRKIGRSHHTHFHPLFSPSLPPFLSSALSAPNSLVNFSPPLSLSPSLSFSPPLSRPSLSSHPFLSPPLSSSSHPSVLSSLSCAGSGSSATCTRLLSLPPFLSLFFLFSPSSSFSFHHSSLSLSLSLLSSLNWIVSFCLSLLIFVLHSSFPPYWEYR
ncbi:hypothetical protein SRHO_G00101990 [Serrasalmus rhombeus]